MRLLGIKRLARYPNKRTANVVLACLGIVLVAWGSIEFIDMHKATNSARTPTEAITTITTTSPDETELPKDCNTFNTHELYPYRISIERIGVDSCIQRVTIDQHNNVAAPTNIHLAGWYINSPAPGAQGVSLINGHVHGRYAKGIFGDLHQLTTGDTIDITLGNSTVHTFAVLEVETYTVQQAAEEMLTKLNSTDRQLTLITCTGDYVNEQQTYDKRLVVRAKAT